MSHYVMMKMMICLQLVLSRLDFIQRGICARTFMSGPVSLRFHPALNLCKDFCLVVSASAIRNSHRLINPNFFNIGVITVIIFFF